MGPCNQVQWLRLQFANQTVLMSQHVRAVRSLNTALAWGALVGRGHSRHCLLIVYTLLAVTSCQPAHAEEATLTCASYLNDTLRT